MLGPLSLIRVCIFLWDVLSRPRNTVLIEDGGTAHFRLCTDCPSGRRINTDCPSGDHGETTIIKYGSVKDIPSITSRQKSKRVKSTRNSDVLHNPPNMQSGSGGSLHGGLAEEPLTEEWTNVPVKIRSVHRNAKEAVFTDSFHRIATLNVNSINNIKFRYLTDYLIKANNCVVALTELVSENSELNHLLGRDNRFPILSDNRCKRVGLMVPKYLEHCFEIIDTFSVSQFRKRKSQSVCQTTTFRFSYSKIMEVITVVYLAPDAN